MHPVNMQCGTSTCSDAGRMLLSRMARVANVRVRFARAVRTRRDALGLTQEEAAGRSDLNVRYWRDIEAARPAPGLESIEHILTALEWSWHDLADALAPKEVAGAPTATHRLLDEAWRRSSAREREPVMAGLRVLVRRKV